MLFSYPVFSFTVFLKQIFHICYSEKPLAHLRNFPDTRRWYQHFNGYFKPEKSSRIFCDFPWSIQTLCLACNLKPKILTSSKLHKTISDLSKKFKTVSKYLNFGTGNRKSPLSYAKLDEVNKILISNWRKSGFRSCLFSFWRRAMVDYWHPGVLHPQP